MGGASIPIVHNNYTRRLYLYRQINLAQRDHSMARGKGLTPEGLAKLGAKQLAELLAQACENDPQLRHRVEIVHASKQGIDELEGILAKRIISLSRARALLDWSEEPKLP